MTVVPLGMPRLPRGAGVRPDVSELLDSHGRTARDLRVSLTEKCSLRCTYCMPAEGLPAVAPSRLMATDEVIRLVALAVNHLGITEVRFTGGEPLLRADLAAIVTGCVQEAGGATYSMTTNGVGLEHRAEALAAAGLERVNVSLDTIDRDVFTALTRRDRIGSVIAGVRAAVRHGLAPVKVNAVALPQTLAGAPDLLRWCIDQGVSLRFIESMPLDADRTWSKDSMVTAEVLLEELNRHFTLTPRGREDAAAPAELWEVDGGPATVGIIGSVTRSFCGDCDRTRLTARGAISSCLFDDTETDLLKALRDGAEDLALAEAWRAAMWIKPSGHGIDSDTFTPPNRTMGAIGG